MMAETLIWISGASSGIGKALATTLPWEHARLIGVCRRPPAAGEHLEADLADPRSWERVGQSFERELRGWSGGRVVFVHAAGVVGPIGFAGEVDTDSCSRSILLNSAAPQVLGQMFLAAAREVEARRQIVMLTSGAASSIYPGWAPYGAGKAAVDQWVRDVGAEQDLRGGVELVAVAPGTVETGMQEQIRLTEEKDFPQRQKFVDLHRSGQLADPDRVAADIWALLDRGLENGAVVDLRKLTDPAPSRRLRA
jgi:benzil reductase ((S)-benzoin forming)